MTQDSFYRRIDVWNDTEKTAPPLIGQEATKHTWAQEFDYRRKYDSTFIAVKDQDLIDMARTLAKYKPLVVNPSDDCFPGGCVNVGSGAAEESLFRRSNYFRSLTLHHYPIKNEQAVYSPTITVFKEGEDNDFKACRPFKLDFVACPGVRHPVLTNDGRLTPEDTEVLEKKIELILQIAQLHDHNVIIMAALGCGAWKNPPHDVAEAFKRVIAKHDGVVKAIIFAIKRNVQGYIVKFDDRPDNYTTFKSILTPDSR
jgi:uncharacterized protein (TIGR02452 family)